MYLHKIILHLIHSRLVNYILCYVSHKDICTWLDIWKILGISAFKLFCILIQSYIKYCIRLCTNNRKWQCRDYCKCLFLKWKVINGLSLLWICINYHRNLLVRSNRLVLVLVWARFRLELARKLGIFILVIIYMMHILYLRIWNYLWKQVKASLICMDMCF